MQEEKAVTLGIAANTGSHSEDAVTLCTASGVQPALPPPTAERRVLHQPALPGPPLKGPSRLLVFHPP